MANQKVIRTRKQLDDIVRTNTAETIQQMLQDDAIIWDADKYTLVASDPRQSSDEFPPPISDNRDMDSLSGVKAAFKNSYAVKIFEINGSLGMNQMDKVDLFFSEGFEVTGIRQETLNLGLTNV